MFSLNGAVTYKYIPNYQDMRGGYEKLSGVVRSWGNDPEDGTAYVFTSKDPNRHTCFERTQAEGRTAIVCM